MIRQLVLLQNMLSHKINHDSDYWSCYCSDNRSNQVESRHDFFRVVDFSQIQFRYLFLDDKICQRKRARDREIPKNQRRTIKDQNRRFEKFQIILELLKNAFFVRIQERFLFRFEIENGFDGFGLNFDIVPRKNKCSKNEGNEREESPDEVDGFERY